jgi:hypothetical protein
MRPGAAPLGEQIAILVLGPPIMSCMWWVMSRGRAMSIQGGAVSETTKRRQKKEFWVIFILMYVMLAGIFIYGWVT